MLMLEYLNTGNKYTVKELSQKVGVTERMIRYYKQELENAGIYIETFMGPGGGYFILSPVTVYNHINKYDVELMENILNKLKKTNFKYLNEFSNLIDKIKNLYKIEEEKSKFNNDLKNDIIDITKLSKIKKHIKMKDKLKIIYEDLNGEKRERWIHPLQLFKFKDKVFVTAYCELRNDIRHFEISRIKEIEEQK